MKLAANLFIIIKFTSENYLKNNIALLKCRKKIKLPLKMS